MNYIKRDFKQIGSDKWIITGGGHSQESINFMNDNNIGYEINIIYENGVRVGNVFCHKDPKKAIGNGQTWFPKSWTKEKIEKAGNTVAKKVLKEGKKNGKFFGEVDGVRVGIILKNGKIETVFPDSKQEGAIKYERKKI